VLRKTAAACAVTAAAALVAFTAFGWWRAGLAVAIGLVLGSLNGPLARHALGTGVDFRVSSMFRLGILSALGIAVGALLGWSQVPFVIGGVAASQLLLAGVAAVEVSRA
jgi:hypothetical protein